MIVPTTPPWPRNLILHEFSYQPRTRKCYPRNLIRVRYVYVMLEGLSNVTTQNKLPTMWPQKLNKLDDKKFNLKKRGIGIESQSMQTS